jgi:hypothetical protein
MQQQAIEGLEYDWKREIKWLRCRKSTLTIEGLALVGRH